MADTVYADAVRLEFKLNSALLTKKSEQTWKFRGWVALLKGPSTCTITHRPTV